ncbi:hypothetical protein [uncultured Maribacter sp.]|uniref:hypothetical protein n=1 Tax=uncultured Maribacter sp. TaxID=431308 RepID=UPI002616AA42|nr:hypothetical protein [uncultured Maribacter sp.]
MMKAKWILILVSLFLINCNSSDDSKEDCSAVSCLEMGYTIELISKDSETNWIIENGYTKEDIQLLNTEEEIVPFGLHNGNIWITTSNSNHGMHTLIIDELEIPYSYDFTEPDGSCCDFGDLTDVIVPNNEFKVSDFQLKIFL